MSLSEKISNEYKEALKSGDKVKVSVLRMIRASAKNREIEKGESLSDSEFQSVMASFVKRAKESIEQYSRAGRADLAEKEKKEILIVQGYLPEQMSGEKISQIIRETIEATGAAGPGDMGKVMKAVMEKLKGQADGRIVNNLVKEMLEAL